MTRLSEDDLIATLFAPLAGPGGLGLRDDAAVLSAPDGHDVVVTTDAIVSGIHFFADDPPDSIAVKALGVNLSDLAAKAADPAGFVLTLALPDALPADWLEAFASGLGKDAARHGCPLLGGDTVRTSGPLTLSITAFGIVPRGSMLPRTGAKPGDWLYVSGTIGDAALGLRLRLQDGPDGLGAALQAGLDATAKTHLIDRYLHPRPRLALRAALRAHAHAGMDVSDGLLGDITKMLRVSDVTGRIDISRIPLSPAARAAVAADNRALQAALAGGDDYEIIATVSPEMAEQFEAAAAYAAVSVTRIGVLAAGTGLPVFHDASGTEVHFAAKSFSHF